MEKKSTDISGMQSRSQGARTKRMPELAEKIALRRLIRALRSATTVLNDRRDDLRLVHATGRKTTGGEWRYAGQLVDRFVRVAEELKYGEVWSADGLIDHCNRIAEALKPTGGEVNRLKHELKLKALCSEKQEAELEAWLRQLGHEPESLIAICREKYPALDRFQISAIVLRLRNEAPVAANWTVWLAPDQPVLKISDGEMREILKRAGSERRESK